MIKFVGCLLVLISGVCIGRFFGATIKFRLDNIKELRKLLIYLQNEIRYSNTPLPEALSWVAQREKGVFKNFFLYVSERLENGGEKFETVWIEGINNRLDNTGLTDKDKEIFAKLSDIAGGLDKQMQIDKYSFCITYCDEVIYEITDDIKEKTKLYNILGASAGIFTVIIFL